MSNYVFLIGFSDSHVGCVPLVMVLLLHSFKQQCNGTLNKDLTTNHKRLLILGKAFVTFGFLLNLKRSSVQCVSYFVEHYGKLLLAFIVVKL